MTFEMNVITLLFSPINFLVFHAILAVFYPSLAVKVYHINCVSNLNGYVVIQNSILGTCFSNNT